MEIETFEMANEDEAEYYTYDVNAMDAIDPRPASPAGICIDVAYGRKGKFVEFIIPQSAIAAYVERHFDLAIAIESLDATVKFTPKAVK